MIGASVRGVAETEEPLTGGNLNAGVIRVGDTVRREAGPWTRAVHGLLLHLAESGYPPPVLLGFDAKDREIVTFIEGPPIHPDRYDLVAQPQGLARAARLIAEYHAAQATFLRPPDASWRADARDPSGSEEVLAHNDLAPWNLIAGPVWTYIDWDLVAPGRRSWDLAWALHSFVGLWPDSGDTPAATAERITAFCDGASVPHADRVGLLRVVVERTQHNADELRRRAAAGEPAYERLVATGHAEVWQRGSEHVASHLDLWARFLMS